jgi:hypothetical protein
MEQLDPIEALPEKTEDKMHKDLGQMNQLSELLMPLDSEEELYNDAELHAHQRYMCNQCRALINRTSVVNQGFQEDEVIETLFFQNYFGNDIEVLKEWQLLNESVRNAYLNDFENGERGDMIYGRLCNSILLFKEIKGMRKHVLVSQLNANWGALSTVVPNRTADWGKWEDHFTGEGCTIDDFWWYINHPNVSAVFTTTHQWLDHPKIIAVPLGVGDTQPVAREVALQEMDNRTELLLISQSAAPYRVMIADHVIANFNRTIRNRYNNDSDFWHDLRHSKFILCPSGMGWDTYRAWNALCLGTIPVYWRHTTGKMECIISLTSSLYSG